MYLRPYLSNSFFTNHSVTFVYQEDDSIIKLTTNKYGNEVIIFDVIMIVLENESGMLYHNNGVKMVCSCRGYAVAVDWDRNEIHLSHANCILQFCESRSIFDNSETTEDTLA